MRGDEFGQIVEYVTAQGIFTIPVTEFVLDSAPVLEAVSADYAKVAALGRPKTLDISTVKAQAAEVYHQDVVDNEIKSADAKRKMAEAKKGKVLPHMVGGNNPSARRVYCSTTGETFDTASQAARKYNCDLSSIIKCCKGKQTHVKGLRFEYAPGVFGWVDQGPA